MDVRKRESVRWRQIHRWQKSERAIAGKRMYRPQWCARWQGTGSFTSHSLLLLHSSSHCSIEQQCFAMEFHLFDVHFRKVKHQYIDSAAATSAVAGDNAVRCISMASHWRPFRQNTKHQNNSIEFVPRDGVNCIYVFVCYCLQCTLGWFVKKVTKINIFNAFVLPTGLSYQAGSGNFSPETSGMPLHNSNWSKKNKRPVHAAYNKYNFRTLKTR